MRLLCEVLDVPRSSAYYEPRPGEDRPLLDALMDVAGQWPTYGYRRLTKQLQREGHAVNAKRVRRLMHELGIVGKAPEKKPRTTDSGHAYPRYPNLVEDLKVTRPDQVWVADITYIRLRKEFIYLAVLMDIYHPLHQRLEPRARAGPGIDADRLETGVRARSPGDPSFRPGGAICRDGLRRDADQPRGEDQHGERWRARREWIC